MKIARIALPMLGLVALTACSTGQAEDPQVSLASSSDLQRLEQRVTGLESELQQARTNAQEARAAAEESREAVQRMEGMFRERQRK